jgi:hypothetical protein
MKVVGEKAISTTCVKLSSDSHEVPSPRMMSQTNSSAGVIVHTTLAKPSENTHRDGRAMVHCGGHPAAGADRQSLEMRAVLHRERAFLSGCEQSPLGQM